MRPAERAGCSVSISATNFQRPCTREATESRSRPLSSSWITQGVPVNGNDVHSDHEDRLAANPDSSEVRLTPRLQLRLSPVDRIAGNAHKREVRKDPTLAGVFGTAQGSQGRFCRSVSHDGGPTRQGRTWPSRQDWPASPTRQWDDATTNPKRLPSSDSMSTIPRNRAGT
jgi:hypothetical protein